MRSKSADQVRRQAIPHASSNARIPATPNIVGAVLPQPQGLSSLAPVFGARGGGGAATGTIADTSVEFDPSEQRTSAETT